MVRMVSVVGKSDSGKTTLVEKLIPELKSRGYRIGVIKHAHHGFDMDRKGKDSWRHKEAGADMVMVSSPGRIAMVKDEPRDEPGALEGYFEGMDLVVVEGFKKARNPKIEIFREGVHEEPLCGDDPDLIAFVTDSAWDLGVPRFGLDDISAIVDLIEERFPR